MRQLYQSRRDALAQALERTFGSALETRPPVGGMHFLARLPAGTDDRALVTRAAVHGLAPEPFSRSFAQRPTAPGLLLGFTNIPEDAALAAARRLKDVLEA
jgi:GntR family transcriptional regulator / MocR family aminotransferase